MNHLRIILALLSLLLPTSLAHGQGCSADINGDGKVDGGDLALVLSNWGTCPPSITSVTPPQGSVLGGTVITITGTGLSSTVAVSVGGAPCTAVTVLSPTQVRATTPPGAAGQVAIAVTTPAGTSLAPLPFNYVLQSVTSISPSSGPYVGGTPITITGQYLSGTTAVTIGGVPVPNLVVVSSTMVTAVTPAGSVGAADVIVTGSKGTLNLTGGFSYRAVISPAWASLVAALPDPEVIPNESLRNAIAATGYAWHVRDSGTGIEMLLIPPGSFNMGCSSSGVYSCDMKEIPVHPVSLSSPFYMGRYEVTQAQWLAKMGTNPSYWQARPENGNTADTNRPVENVSWNMITGAGGFLLGTGLRLPTEAEWEYACRAGTTTAFHGFPGQLGGTNDDAHITNISWFDGNNGTSGTAAWGTKAVGQKLANGFGLHDMSGNVWEWVNDWDSNTYYAWSPLTDPPGPEAGLYRVLRGGSWGANTFYLRSSSRVGEWPSTSASNGNYGLRVVRNP